MKEEWREIKDFPMYNVSNRGRVRSYKRGHLHSLKPILNSFYFHVNLFNETGTYFKYVHILVLEAFKGSRPDGLIGNHKDGIKTNNYANNLKWVTHSEDSQHAYRLGLNKSWQTGGEKSSNAKLKDKEVWWIKRLLWFDYKYKEIAEMFKIRRSNICKIKNGRIWQHIKFEPTDEDRKYYKENF